MVAACLLVEEGIDSDVAMLALSSIRGVDIPETEEQKQWIYDFAGALTNGDDEPAAEAASF